MDDDMVPVPDGPVAVRPVASGEFLRRLVGKFLVRRHEGMEEAADLCPQQLGVGVKGSTDLLPQGVQALVNSLWAQEPRGEWGVLKVDVKNAFNCMSRKAML